MVTPLDPRLLCPPAHVSVGVKVMVGAVVSAIKSISNTLSGSVPNDIHPEYSFVVVLRTRACQCFWPSERPLTVTFAFVSEVQLAHAPPPTTVPSTASAQFPAPHAKAVPVGFTSTCSAIFMEMLALISALRITVDSFVEPPALITVALSDLYCLLPETFGSFGTLVLTVNALAFEV